MAEIIKRLQEGKRTDPKPDSNGYPAAHEGTSVRGVKVNGGEYLLLPWDWICFQKKRGRDYLVMKMNNREAVLRLAFAHTA